MSHDETVIIESYLKGVSPGFEEVKNWIDTVLQFHGWGTRLDIVEIRQATLVAVLDNLQQSKYKGQGLKGYVQSICKRICLDDLRKSYRKERFLAARELQTPASVSQTPESILIEKEKNDSFHQIMLELSDQCRQLLRWKFYDHFSHKEIGDKLGLTAGASRVRVHRCLEETSRIRARLEED